MSKINMGRGDLFLSRAPQRREASVDPSKKSDKSSNKSGSNDSDRDSLDKKRAPSPTPTVPAKPIGVWANPTPKSVTQSASSGSAIAIGPASLARRLEQTRIASSSSRPQSVTQTKGVVFQNGERVTKKELYWEESNLAKHTMAHKDYLTTDKLTRTSNLAKAPLSKDVKAYIFKNSYDSPNPRESRSSGDIVKVSLPDMAVAGLLPDGEIKTVIYFHTARAAQEYFDRNIKNDMLRDRQRR